MKNTFAIVCLLTLLASCNKGSSGSKAAILPTEPEQSLPEEVKAPAIVLDGSNIQGVYLAKFTTLNPGIVGTIPGSAQFRRIDDRISAYVRLFAGSPDTAHFQNVHSGNRCPTMPEDDKNEDGFIDIKEALAVVGPVIIPLDADLTTQLSGNSLWSKSFPNGSYEYMVDTNFDGLLDDMRDEDENPRDNISKIASDAPFDLAGKVFMVQGVGPEKVLPESIASLPKYKNHQTFPIACGVYIPGPMESGTLYEDVITGPVAPVEETIDQPAPEGADEIQIPGKEEEEPVEDTLDDDTEIEETPTTESQPEVIEII
ncbi:MAG TPA: hypothetical protein VNJ08_11690 [Bacteriovoracaceae bacterium]|nr:hypothetical protein [Bacteriovoracaceae bacterium]